MFNRKSYNLIGPVRSVTSTFFELEADGNAIVEIRPKPGGYFRFDPEGRLLEEVSPDRILMEDIFRDVYVYNADGELVERLEYNEEGKPVGKTVFEIDDSGNLVENHYYFSPDGRLLLGSKLFHRDCRVGRVNFYENGTVVQQSYTTSEFPKSTTEFSETRTDDGHIVEERRYNEKGELTLRIVTRYDRHGNEKEYSTFDHELDGEMYITQEYEYEFDPVGNWTTQTVHRWVVGWGPFRLIPYTRTRQEIEYF